MRWAKGLFAVEAEVKVVTPLPLSGQPDHRSAIYSALEKRETTDETGRISWRSQR